MANEPDLTLQFSRSAAVSLWCKLLPFDGIRDPDQLQDENEHRMKQKQSVSERKEMRSLWDFQVLVVR